MGFIGQICEKPPTPPENPFRLHGLHGNLSGAGLMAQQPTIRQSGNSLFLAASLLGIRERPPSPQWVVD